MHRAPHPLWWRRTVHSSPAKGMVSKISEEQNNWELIEETLSKRENIRFASPRQCRQRSPPFAAEMKPRKIWQKKRFWNYIQVIPRALYFTQLSESNTRLERRNLKCCEWFKTDSLVLPPRMQFCSRGLEVQAKCDYTLHTG